MAKKKHVHGVVCYWEWIPGKREAYVKRWKLVEAYGIDMDGYPLTTPKNSPGRSDRQEWDNWMNERYVPKGNDEEDYDMRPIMGRAVTFWSVEGGVSLGDIHPPKWIDMLSIQFVSELKKTKNWHAMLEDGHTLYLGTARAAEKILFGEES